MSLRPVARLVAALVPALLLLPAVAHAETVTVEDGAGDARALNFGSDLGGFLFGESSEDEQPLFLHAPAEVATDVVRTTVQHARRITVTTQFRDLVDTMDHSLDMLVVTPDGRFSLLADKGPDGTGYGLLMPPRFSGEGKRPRFCRTVRVRYDYVADTVTASFPAACVGDPRWIQLGSYATRLQVTPLGDGSVNVAGWVDDAFRAHVSERSRGKSPRVHRG